MNNAIKEKQDEMKREACEKLIVSVHNTTQLRTVEKTIIGWALAEYFGIKVEVLNVNK